MCITCCSIKLIFAILSMIAGLIELLHYVLNRLIHLTVHSTVLFFFFYSQGEGSHKTYSDRETESRARGGVKQLPEIPQPLALHTAESLGGGGSGYVRKGQGGVV